MQELIIWKNQQFDKLRKEMDSIFDRLWGEFDLPAFPRTAREFPAINLTETKDNLMVQAKVPDINPNDIRIDISENSLTMKGEIAKRRVNGKKGLVKVERHYRSFSRRGRCHPLMLVSALCVPIHSI